MLCKVQNKTLSFTKWEEWMNDQKDPLDTFCNEYPWNTECKVYDA
jgi:hypothetical protein